LNSRLQVMQGISPSLQHTATRHSTLQHDTTHCNTLQHASYVGHFNLTCSLSHTHSFSLAYMHSLSLTHKQLVATYAELLNFKFDEDSASNLNNASIFYFDESLQPKQAHLVANARDFSLIAPTAEVRGAREFLACLLSKRGFFMYAVRILAVQYLLNRGIHPIFKQ